MSFGGFGCGRFPWCFVLRGVGIICISACFLRVWVGLLAGIVGFWVLSGEGLFFLVLVRVLSVSGF